MTKISLLVLVNSDKKENYFIAKETIFSALNHFGMIYEILDLSKEIISYEKISPFSGIIIAQENIDISSLMKDIAKYIYKGGGLVDFGNKAYRNTEISGINFSGMKGEFASLNIGEVEHYITSSYEKEKLELKKPLEFLMVKKERDVSVLLQTQDGFPLAVASRYGKGKLVKYLFPLKFWLPDYFGHLHGLDTFFYKSIVWAAKKPFIMMAMPPFITARIDDASGSGSKFLISKDSAAISFKYIDILNKYGYVPNIGLFTDDISNEDGKILKKKYDDGLAEFSPHAFKEDKPGENNLIYMKRVHNKQDETVKAKEYSHSQLNQFFSKLNIQFNNWGIKPSKVVNSHYENPGVNALSYLKERGQVFMMFASIFGKLYNDPEAYNWKPKPYGHPGFIFDYMTNYPDFFVAEAHPYKVLSEGKITDADIDFLWNNTVFLNENSFNDLEAAARKASAGIKLSLDSLFFACLMTHEQRIASLSIKEWEEVLNKIDKLTRKHEGIFKSYDYIAEYGKSRYDTKIVEAKYDSVSKGIKLRVIGKSTLPLKIYVFTDEGDSCRCEFKEIPKFKGEKEFILKIYE